MSIEGELLPAKAAAVALSAMGLMAAMLAVTGIFGMAAYSVSRRMKELGIRVALGAGRARVMQSAVGRPLALLLGGLAVGSDTGGAGEAADGADCVPGGAA
jgi:ABC-type antimicrobial peptide transport system permease subunit